MVRVIEGALTNSRRAKLPMFIGPPCTSTASAEASVLVSFGVPGLAIALLGAGLRREFAPLGRPELIPSAALIAAGLLMALSGAFPANMADFSSTTTRLHLVGSFGCYAAFLIAGFWFPSFFRRFSSWHWAARPSLVLVWGSIAIGFMRFLEGMGGLGQRLTFFCFFLWIALVGFALLRANRHATAA